MNSFKTTKIFSLIDKVFQLSPIISTLDQWIGKYTIDRDKYDYLVQICKTYKYQLSKEVVSCLERNEIIPFNSQDPKNPEDKLMNIPTSISSLSGFDKNKKVVTYVDTSMRASYTRNKLNKEIEAYSINEKDFYTSMQRGYVARKLIVGNAALSSSPNFIRAVMNSYARLMAKPISAVYGTGAKAEWMNKLYYITCVFCLQNFFNYEIERAKTFALSMPGLSKTYIVEESKIYNRDSSKIDMRSSTDPIERGKLVLANSNNGVPVYPIDIYVELLKSEFEEMRTGKIEYRSILDRFTSMYGQNSMTSIEHCESFINMIITSEMKCGIYNDRGIFDIAKDDIKTICTILTI